MNPQFISYYCFVQGKLKRLLALNYREGMPIPAKGFNVCLPNHETFFEVTKVTFNIPTATVEIEVVKLFGTKV